MKRETLLVELCADWVARLDVDHGNPPTVAVAVISAAEADAVELPTEADAVANPTATEAEADAVELPTEADAVETPTDAATEAEAVATQTATATATEAERAPAFCPPVAVVNRRRLAAAVRRLGATVGKRKNKTHKLALAVSVAVDSGAVFLQTFNNDAEAVEIIPAETGQNVRIGQTVVDFATLKTAVGVAKSETVLIDATDAAALAVGAVQLPRVADPAEFPVVDVANFGQSSTVMIDAATLVETLAAVIGAADSENTRYALNAVFLELGAGGFVRAVATDGRRMHVSEAGEQTDTTATALIPVAVAAAVIDSATAAGNAVCVNFYSTPTEAEAVAAPIVATAARFCFFDATAGNCGEITTRTVDGRFVNWARIFETETRPLARVDAAALGRVVSVGRAVLKTGKDETRGLEISATVGRLQLQTGRNSAVGFSESVAAEIVDDSAAVCLDAVYLLDALTGATNCGGGRVALSLAESGALHFEDAGARVRFRALVMPLHDKRPKPETTETAAAASV